MPTIRPMLRPRLELFDAPAGRPRTGAVASVVERPARLHGGVVAVGPRSTRYGGAWVRTATAPRRVGGGGGGGGVGATDDVDRRRLDHDQDQSAWRVDGFGGVDDDVSRSTSSPPLTSSGSPAFTTTMFSRRAVIVRDPSMPAGLECRGRDGTTSPDDVDSLQSSSSSSFHDVAQLLLLLTSPSPEPAGATMTSLPTGSS